VMPSASLEGDSAMRVLVRRRNVRPTKPLAAEWTDRADAPHRRQCVDTFHGSRAVCPAMCGT